MKFDKLSDLDLEGKHAFLAPSSSSWLRYSEERLRDRWRTIRAAEEGTELHALAAKLIDKKIKLQKTQKTLNMYVNDCIGFGLETEVPLYYSEFAFGHADAIGYSEKQKILRVSDLKTGVTIPSREQLMVYDALFFLQYGNRLKINPNDLVTENRIYQNNQIDFWVAEPAEIMQIMDIIEKDSFILQKVKGEC